jgi:5-methylcytosine-specific restriction protein B
MLECLNKRIELLYDREHTLGHAFFMPLLDIESEQSQFVTLQSIFSNKILPLLEEYFFEDWEKIRLVLADNQKPLENQFVRIKENVDPRQLFGDLDDSQLLDEDSKVYLRYRGELDPAAYKMIYEI